MTMLNGRIAAVQEIEQMVARLGLSREERAATIERVTGERSLVRLNGYQLASVREHLEEKLPLNAGEGDTA